MESASSPSLDDLPPFVKPTGEVLQGIPTYNFWDVERTGCDDVDRLTGVRHFGDALTYARAEGKPLLLSHILGTMHNHFMVGGPSCDSIAHGFIDALALKAYVGRLSDPIDDAAIVPLQSIPGAIDQFRFLEGSADAIFALARESNDPSLIAIWIKLVLFTETERFVGGAALRAASAAYNGASN